jgi:hypothetical protein
MRAKLDQLPDLSQGETQPLHLPDEAKTLDGVFCVEPESTRTAGRLRQELAPLIKPDRIDGQRSSFSNFPDLHVCAPI